MSIAVLMQQLRDAGAPMEAIMIAVAAVEAVEAKHLAAEEARKADQRERTARSRSKSRYGNVTVTGLQRDSDVTPQSSPTPPKTTPVEDTPSDPKGSSAPQGARQPRKARNRALPDDWTPGPASDAARRELGRSADWMAETAKDLRIWANGGGHVRTDWDLVHIGWMRREAKRECERPSQRAGPASNPKTHHVALNRLADRLRIPDEPDRTASRFADHGPVIDHAGDGPDHRGLYEPAGGDAGQPAQASHLRVASSRWG